MGMTPLEGLMMGTRSGSIDPGVVLAALRPGRLSAAELEDALDHHSGLLGVSGQSADMRELLVGGSVGRPGREPGSGAVRPARGRRDRSGRHRAATFDGLVFTGGIGANAGPVRSRIAARLSVLGLPALPDADTDADGVLTEPGSRPAVLRVEAREDLVIAAEAASLLRA